MVLLRRVIGDALRARRQSQHRTLREVSTAANVSLGYLSEIERGQKEASSELLASICGALGTPLSDVLREASDTVALAEQMDEVLGRVAGGDIAPARQDAAARVPSPAGAARVPVAHAAAVTRAGAAPSRVPTTPRPPTRTAGRPSRALAVEGDVAVTISHELPLRTTLRATRGRPAVVTGARDVAYV